MDRMWWLYLILKTKLMRERRRFFNWIARQHRPLRICRRCQKHKWHHNGEAKR